MVGRRLGSAPMATNAPGPCSSVKEERDRRRLARVVVIRDEVGDVEVGEVAAVLVGECVGTA